MRWPWQRRPDGGGHAGSGLSEPNVPADWVERHLWAEWPECPRNLVAGEASYAPALAALAGAPCASGYCLPVAVELVREPDNGHDVNAFRAEVQGRRVGYLRRMVAEQLAGPLDAVGCSSFTVAGVVRGGSMEAPNLGCHVWLGRRLTPGPSVSFDDDAYEVAWPPFDGEVFGTQG